MDLSKVLAQLREAGVSRARYAEGQGDERRELEVQFGPDLQSVGAGLVGQDGRPVDLDAGMGPLERDEIEEKYRPAPKGKPAS